MLSRFVVKNFLSIYDKQEFSMYAGASTKYKKHISDIKNTKTLKYASLHGANASGKSNLIEAIRFAKQAILNGLETIECQEKYCKIKDIHKNEDSNFEFELIINERVYSYGFILNLYNSEVVEEWLYELKSNSEDKMIFYRNNKKNIKDYNKKLFTSENKNKFQVWIEDSLNQKERLFLSEIYNKNNPSEDLLIFKNIYTWFSEKLIIIYPDEHFHTAIFNIQKYSNLVCLLNKMDTGIKDIEYIEIEKGELPIKLRNDTKLIELLKKILKKGKKNKQEKQVLSNISYLYTIELDTDEELLFKKVVFKHSKDENATPLEFYEESDGTKRLIELLQAINVCISEGKTLLIDEIERSLHPKLIIKLIDYYLENISKPLSQLIITTHEDHLLNLKKIRRDSIWFVEKNYEGYSSIYSLDEYKVRNDLVLEKAYLEGRYGGVPIIGKLNKIQLEDCE